MGEHFDKLTDNQKWAVEYDVGRNAPTFHAGKGPRNRDSHKENAIARETLAQNPESVANAETRYAEHLQERAKALENAERAYAEQQKERADQRSPSIVHSPQPETDQLGNFGSPSVGQSSQPERAR